MTIEQQQCLLGMLGLYTLRRADGSLAVDGLTGPSTRAAILQFQLVYGNRPDGTSLVADGLWGPKTEAAVRQVIGAGEAPQKRPGSQDGEIPDWWKKYPAVRRENWQCRCGGRFCNGYPAEPHEETVAMLQQFADHFGGEIRWHSGLRCPRYNASIPGASPNSKHQFGMAYDFHMDGISPSELAAYAETLMPDRGGIGIYPWGIHLDDRKVKARWKG